MADARFARFLNPFPLTSAAGGSISANNQGLTSSGHKLGQCFYPQLIDTITHLGFRYGLRTGTPPTYRVSLQALGGDGKPTGTVLGGGSPASATFTPPADTTWDTTWQWVALTNSYLLTSAEFASGVAVIVDYSSGTVDGSNNSSFLRNWNAGGIQGIPYYALDTGTGYAIASSGFYPPGWGMKSATAVYGFPFQSLYTTELATTGHRVAAKLTIPSTWGQSVNVAGFRCVGRPASAGTTAKIGVWDSGGVVGSTVTVDSDCSGNSGAGGEFMFSAPITLTYGTTYYIGFESISNSNCRLTGCQFAAAADLAGLAGGNYCILATYNGTTWSDVTTVRPMIELILTDITVPAGGSGGLLGSSVMTGGFHRT